MKFNRVHAPNPKNTQEQLDLIELYAASGEFQALQNVGAYVSNDTIYYNSVDNSGSYTGRVQIAGRFEKGGKVPAYNVGGAAPNAAPPMAPPMSAPGDPNATAGIAPPAQPGVAPEPVAEEPPNAFSILPQNIQKLYHDYKNVSSEDMKKSFVDAIIAHFDSIVPQYQTNNNLIS